MNEQIQKNLGKHESTKAFLLRHLTSIYEALQNTIYSTVALAFQLTSYRHRYH